MVSERSFTAVTAPNVFVTFGDLDSVHSVVNGIKVGQMIGFRRLAFARPK